MELPRNLGPGSLDRLDWCGKNAADSLGVVYQYAVHEATQAIDWYLWRKSRPSRWAQVIRFSAIGLISVGGLIPMLAEFESWGVPAIAASVAIALGGSLLALDRWFGFSSKWVRFIVTAQKLRGLLDEFRLEWQVELAALGCAEPGPDKLPTLIARCAKFRKDTETIVEDETRLWSEEFMGALSQLEATVKARQETARQDKQARDAATPAPGAIEVTVTNGELAAEGWTLRIDGGEASSHRGSKGARGGVPSGARTLLVEGAVGGKALRAEAAVPVAPDAVASVSVTLQ